MTDSLANKLQQLLEQGYMPASQLQQRDRQRLEALFATGALRQQRQGAGCRIVVTKPGAVESFLATHYPGLTEAASAPAPRSQAVAWQGDSKKATTAAPTVLLRGWRQACLQDPDGENLPVACCQGQATALALRLTQPGQWGFQGRLATVENSELFWHLEQLQLPVDLALYTQGRLAGSVRQWLASDSMAGAQILHLGDYDPVGLDEYLQLKAACPGRVQLYQPPHLEQLLQRYGKRELLTPPKSSRLLARLRQQADPEISRLVQLMDTYGCGLEQEALLIEAPPTPRKTS